MAFGAVIARPVGTRPARRWGLSVGVAVIFFAGLQGGVDGRSYTPLAALRVGDRRLVRDVDGRLRGGINQRAAMDTEPYCLLQVEAACRLAGASVGSPIS